MRVFVRQQILWRIPFFINCVHLLSILKQEMFSINCLSKPIQLKKVAIQNNFINLGQIKADDFGSHHNLWNDEIALNCNCAKWQPLLVTTIKKWERGKNSLEEDWLVFTMSCRTLLNYLLTCMTQILRMWLFIHSTNTKSYLV